MIKSLGVGIKYLHNITNSTNYITECLAWLFNLLAPEKSVCYFKIAYSERMLFKFINTSFISPWKSGCYFKIADSKHMLLKFMNTSFFKNCSQVNTIEDIIW